jgi:choline-sulfatase
MNCVFIHSDRHNAEFAGCYGNRVTRTPFIDSIAARGVRFERATCLSPICAPTRAATMTGRYIHEIGVWDNVFSYAGVPHGWGHFFAEQGVCLTTVGKLDFDPEGDHGVEVERLALHRDNLDIHSLFREEEILPRYDLFRKHLDTGPADGLDAYARDAQVVEEAARWLREGRPADRPWVLVVNLNDLHRPWNPPRDLWNHYDPLVKWEGLDERFFEDRSRLHPFHRIYGRHHVGELMGPEETRRALVGYHASCEILDRSVGRVLEALEETGLREEVLLIYAADHGGTCGEHRNFDHGAMYEGSIRIPLVFSGPGVRSGAVDHTAVSAMDIFPTICEAVGLDVPDHVRGTSLLGLLQGAPDAPKPDFALCEYHGAGYPGSLFAVRSGLYKYVECVGERPMLFDLASDPHEMHDLVAEQPDSPRVQETIRRLRQLLYGVCCPEAVDARVKADQRARRKELAESGRLFEEMWKRGYERRTDRLVHRRDFVEGLERRAEL